MGDGLKWSDVTAYSRGEKESVDTARSWEANIAGLRLVVTRHVHHAPDCWVVRCDLFKSDRESEAKNVEDAKREAVAMLKARLDAIAMALGGA